MATATALQNKLESWKPEHDDAMEYWSVEGEVTQRLTDLGDVRSIDEDWGRELRAGRERFDENLARSLFDFYGIWYSSSIELKNRITVVQNKGRAVLRAADFDAACAQVRSIISMPVDEFIESVMQSYGNGSRPLEMVIDELLPEGNG
jgi:hypothetical protein